MKIPCNFCSGIAGAVLEVSCKKEPLLMLKASAFLFIEIAERLIKLMPVSIEVIKCRMFCG